MTCACRSRCATAARATTRRPSRGTLAPPSLASRTRPRPAARRRRDGGQRTVAPVPACRHDAVLLALVVYTASHIAEIVRGSIQAVPRGQGEAADALGLSGFQRLWYVVLPQALRIAIPPIGNQYLNLTKNSSLAAVDQLPRADQGHPARGRQRRPGRAVVHAAAADLPGDLAADLARRQPRQPPPGDRGAMSDGDDRHRDDGDAAAGARAPAGRRDRGDWLRRNLFRSAGDARRHRRRRPRRAATWSTGAVRFVFVTGRWEIVRGQPQAVHGRALPDRRAVADRRSPVVADRRLAGLRRRLHRHAARRSPDAPARAPRPWWRDVLAASCRAVAARSSAWSLAARS